MVELRSERARQRPAHWPDSWDYPIRETIRTERAKTLSTLLTVASMVKE